MTDRKTDYTNEAQQRILTMVMALFGDVVNGFTPGALAKTVGCSASTATRDIYNLTKFGLVECDDNGALRLTPRLPQQAIKIFNAIDLAERRTAEAKQRFSRNPD